MRKRRKNETKGEDKEKRKERKGKIIKNKERI